ncbi:MAG: sialidase family protein, partial [Nitrososphaera sp.]
SKTVACISLSVLLISSFLVIANNSAMAEEPSPSVSETSSPSDGVSAASGSNRFVVWYDDTPGNYEIFFRRSTDNGATWKYTRNLSNNADVSNDPQLAVSGSNIYVVWSDYAPGNADILSKRSTDGGAIWKEVRNLSNNSGGSYGPQIAV